MTAVSPVRARVQVAAALAAVLLSAFAQMTLQPVSAPLAFELGLAPWHVGVAVAASAAMMLLAVPAWMRLLRRFGVRGPLLAALLLATAAMAAFGVLAMLGSRGAVAEPALVAAILGLRGVALGAALAAVVPAARLLIAALDEPALRTRLAAGVATVQGVAVVMGVALGGVLSAFGALLPVVVAPVLLALAALAVVVGVPRIRVATAPVPTTAAVPDEPLVDARTWPFAAVALSVLASVGIVQVVLGFVLHDRLGLDAATTGFAAGCVLFVGGLAAVVAQTRIARGARRPVLVARVGVVLALVGLGSLVVASELVVVLGGVLVAGIGVGLALPGVARAVATSTDGGHAQRLMATVTVLGAVVGPLVGTLLLGISSAAPFVACAAALAIGAALVFAHPAFRASDAPEPLAEAAAA